MNVNCGACKKAFKTTEASVARAKGETFYKCPHCGALNRNRRYIRRA